MKSAGSSNAVCEICWLRGNIWVRSEHDDLATTVQPYLLQEIVDGGKNSW
jgi:hypothetical protein